MRVLLGWLVIAASACTVTVDDHGPCIENNGEPIMLVNPETLECQTFAPDACDPSCGPCAAGATVLPSWGRCSSACRNLDELACSQAPACRVARDFDLYYALGGSNDKATFAGCWPLDQAPQVTAPCYGLDATSCSMTAACTALYDGAVDARVFASCVPAQEHLGKCTGPIQCNAIAPPCPPEFVPGIDNGCFTGSCLPRDFCGVIDFPPML